MSKKQFPYFTSANIDDNYGVEIGNNPNKNSRRRAVLVLGEMYLNTLLVIPLESLKENDRLYKPFEVLLPKSCGCPKDSKLLILDIRTIRKEWLKIPQEKYKINIRLNNDIEKEVRQKYRQLRNPSLYLTRNLHDPNDPTMKIRNKLVEYKIDEDNVGYAIGVSDYVRVDKTAKAYFFTETQEIRSFDRNRVRVIDMEEKKEIELFPYNEIETPSIISNLYFN
ncbi:hypothetical protein WAF17_19295 [Bernardetia sp. ABR2-2B]|uniref:hypothetical protein n=1 Tax=Bernardetia sp. ABR2-2B TaxID=3127472 RepID=UPI0030CB9CD2